MLEILLSAHKPLSISELGKLSNLGRNRARGFADRIILGKAGVPTPPGVKVIDILMSRLNSTHHYRFIGIQSENYWEIWLESAYKEGYRISRDHFGIFPNYEIDPEILMTFRQNLPRISIEAKSRNLTSSQFMKEMFDYILHPNFEKGRSLLNIIASAAQNPDNLEERKIAISFLSRAGFFEKKSGSIKEGA